MKTQESMSVKLRKKLETQQLIKAHTTLPTLHFTPTTMPVDKIVMFLKKFGQKKIQDLRIENYGASLLKYWPKIVPMLNSMDSLTYLNLSGNSIDNDMLKTLLEALGTKPNLNTLILSENQINVLAPLGAFLKNNPQLKTLNLSKNPIDAHGSSFIKGLVKQSGKLEELIIPECLPLKLAAPLKELIDSGDKSLLFSKGMKMFMPEIPSFEEFEAKYADKLSALEANIKKEASEKGELMGLSCPPPLVQHTKNATELKAAELQTEENVKSKRKKKKKKNV